MRLIILALCMFYTFPALAAEKGDRCTLKNTVFCGKWGGTENEILVVTGDTLTWDYGTYAECTTLEEGFFNGTPSSVLECMRTLHGTQGEIYRDKEFYLLRIQPYPYGDPYFRLYTQGHELPIPYYKYDNEESINYHKQKCPKLNYLNDECWTGGSSPYGRD